MQFYRLLLNLLPAVFLLTAAVSAQNQDRQRLRLAEALNRSGSYEQALPIYKHLYEKGVANRQVINGLKTCYFELAEYDSLVVFLREVVSKHPDQIKYQTELGSAYHLAGHKDKAMKTWKSMYLTQPDNSLIYRLIAQEMIGLNLFDQAIEVYKKALQNVQNQNTLYRDIAMLYRARLNYKEAVRYFLKFYNHFPRQFTSVRSYIVSMSKDRDAVERIIPAIETYLKEHQDEAPVRELLAGMYIKQKDFEKAFKIHKKLHKQFPSGDYLLRFAREAQQNDAYDHAIRGYNLALEQTKDKRREQQIRYDLAQNYFQYGRKLKKASESNPAGAEQKVNRALSILNKLAEASSIPQYRARALELAADIHFEFYHDYDRAADLYQKIIEKLRTFYSIDRIQLKLGNVYLKKNQLQKALQLYQSIENKEYQTLGNYKVAEVQYYRGQFYAALEALQEIQKSLAADDSLMNNCLELQMHINRFRSDSAALAAYSRARLLAYQENLGSAAAAFTKIFNQSNLLSPLAAVEAGRLYKRINQHDEAIQLLNRYLEQYPENRYRDRASIVLAEIFEERGHLQKAVEYYRKIISTQPHSFYLEQARERARVLNEKINQGTSS